MIRKAKKILSLAVCALAVMFLAAPASAMPLKLRFGSDGKFKIVQFTDTHYKWGKKASQAALECINNVVDEENPDLVIFTGDQVYGDGVENALIQMTEPLIERGIPFAMINGNHDHQFDMPLSDQYDLLHALHYSMMPAKEIGVQDADFYIPVFDTYTDKIERIIYCMDTHAWMPLPGETEKGGYGWLTEDQINWYKEKSAHLAKDYNEGDVIPALLFVHIPLPEYREVADEGRILAGVLKEKKGKICCSAYNSGMFEAMKEIGDVSAVFCGHDHDNDFVAEKDGIVLAYGRYSGGNTVYNHLDNGARVIVIDENNPEKIETWIRQRDGKVKDKVSMPTAR